MDVHFATKRFEKACSDARVMNRTCGPERAKQLRKRLVQLRAAEVLADMRRLPGARCHALRGDRKGQLSVDLDGPYRLIFVPADEAPPAGPDGMLDWDRVTAVVSIEIVDTH